MRVRVSEGVKPPRWYGLAYRDFPMMQNVCYPIPFNWVMKWSLSLYWFLVRGGKPHWWSRKLSETFHRGREYERMITFKAKEDVAVAWQEGFDAAIRVGLAMIDGVTDEEKLRKIARIPE